MVEDKAVKLKEKIKGVDLDVVENDLRIVIDTVETLNKDNTSSKADNIQRGVNDARKVLGIFSAIRSIFRVFKKK
ncbi:hypothetical protein Aristophanes_00046 [Acinetobacter phage Aristophanes]|uniref:Uncharacterized protein n=1 Tax=Acinetobacter phage Aristophanes TaxID=2759203 RepID=A0A7G9VYQ5_BPACA|nr:hypothetical protein Aristophanes_00046 [Acinetobacter phage Aristophanes]